MTGAGAGEALPFYVLADILEAIDGASLNTDKRIQRHRLVEKLWQRYGRTTQPMFPLMRLMLPHLDSTRKNCDLQQKLLAQLYVSVHGLASAQDDARKLLEYRQPSSLAGRSVGTAGDFPECAFMVLEHRCPTKEKLGSRRLTVAEVNESLTELANAPNRVKKVHVLRQLHLDTTALEQKWLEQKWLLRIILKHMGMGLKEHFLFSKFHPDAQER
jgi:DNA ligase-4